MAKTIKYGWRLFATGFCFFCFGLGGLLLWALVFSVLIRLLHLPETYVYFQTGIGVSPRLQAADDGPYVVFPRFWPASGVSRLMGVSTG
jgi:hypothetical protein